MDGPVGVDGEDTPADVCLDNGGAAQPPLPPGPLPPLELKLPRDEGGTYPLGPAGGIVGLVTFALG